MDPDHTITISCPVINIYWKFTAFITISVIWQKTKQLNKLINTSKDVTFMVEVITPNIIIIVIFLMSNSYNYTP